MNEYFCGWYFKCRSDQGTFAVIPALHRAGQENSCSVQVITDDGAFYVPFPYDCIKKSREGLHVAVGSNLFSENGMRLSLHTDTLDVSGSVRFGPLSPLRYDIMGPFRFVPFMECRHSVYSMMHAVDGDIRVNGMHYRFRNDTGYIEGDRGRSFPKQYVWTQCGFAGGSLMLSAAHIPFGPFHFTGVTGAVLWCGKEYRIATWLGAKALKIKDGEIVILQGDLRFTAKLLKKNPQPLFAPKGGRMKRTIRESASCRVYYEMARNGRVLLAFESPAASFEYEYDD